MRARLEARLQGLARRLRGAPKLDELRRGGMRIAAGVTIADDAVIDYELCALITIDEGVTIASKAIILAHDASPKQYVDFTIIAPVHLKRGAYIGASSIVLPGVTVGEGSVVGPGSVVTASVDDDTIVMGNPARAQGRVSELAEEHRRRQADAPTWTAAEWPGTPDHSEAEREAVRQAIAAAGAAYLR